MAFLAKEFDLHFPSKPPYPQYLDITDDVRRIVRRSGVRTGTVNVQSLHTTGAIAIGENEPMLLQDTKDALDRLVPSDGTYKHDDIGGLRTENLCEGDECANGHAHIKVLLIGPAQTVNVSGGDLKLGTWQRIFFVDHDRDENVHLVVMGDG